MYTQITKSSLTVLYGLHDKICTFTVLNEKCTKFSVTSIECKIFFYKL